MTSIIVDTNILFSALYARESITRRKLLATKEVAFYTPNFLITELFRHKDRILSRSQATESETYEFLNRLLHRIHFVNEEMISTGNYIEAYRLCNDVDENDTAFVALALEMNSLLWTRDEALVQSLRRKGFNSFFHEKDLR